MNWIACKDQMPKHFVRVLTNCFNTHFVMFWCEEDQKWWSCHDDVFAAKKQITHWMPLPELPKPKPMNNKSTERIKTDAMQPPSKLILDNRTDLPMVDFLSMAQKVVASGRTSDNQRQYCDLTVFVVDNQEYHIASELNENSDKLTLFNPTQPNENNTI